MKVLVQRSLAAKVEVEGEIVGAIDHGQMVLVGIEKGDTEADTQRLADKLLKYRMFSDDDGKMNLNVQQGEQLILYNDLGEIDVFADVTEDIIQGVVMVNHGYWVRHITGKTVNALILSKPSKIGKGITVNDTIVFIKKTNPEAN